MLPKSKDIIFVNSRVYDDSALIQSKGVDTTKMEEFTGIIAMFFFVDSEGNRIAVASSSRK